MAKIKPMAPDLKMRCERELSTGLPRYVQSGEILFEVLFFLGGKSAGRKGISAAKQRLGYKR